MRMSTPEPTLPTWDAWVRQNYDTTASAMRQWVEHLDTDHVTRAKLSFATEQWIAAMNPANFFATNPEALKRAIETNGQSISDGLKLMMADLTRGRVSNTDEDAFEVGRNVAVSEGAVVMRNQLAELIQYAPLTPKVGARPILLVPPCINKFYILDLGPESSFVRFLVEQGHTVFMVSWRNPTPEEDQCTWDDYLQMGVVESIEAVQKICKAKTINTLGFCVGGTILATALAALAARGEKPAESMTLMTTLLDFSDVGELGLFVDPASVAYRESTLGTRGLLSGKELGTTFSFLRPKDLVWNYVSRGYLQGQRPPPFDLLYWNSDGTNLPGPMYCWYLRNMYLENNLRQPGKVESLGEKVDLSLLDMPTYVFAAREDHIVPWQTAYESTRLVGGPTRFALGASGHIAGTINPAKRNKRSYWMAKAGTRKLPAAADRWLEAAVEHQGSWWNDWIVWLNAHRGGEVAARKVPGGAGYKKITAAPGDYVKVRI
jgi:polyhydroxyalkanoate synthase